MAQRHNSELLFNLQPFIVREITRYIEDPPTGSPPVGVTDHGALTGLGDDDHTQYWNNTRGNAAIATHAADVDAHHSPISIAGTTPIGALTLAGQALTFSATSDGFTNVNKVLHVDGSGQVSVKRLAIGQASTTIPLDVVGNAEIEGNVTILGGGNYFTVNGISNFNNAVSYNASANNFTADSAALSHTGTTNFNFVGYGSDGMTFAALGQLIFESYANDLRLTAYGNNLVLQASAGDVTVNTDMQFLGPQRVYNSTGDLTVDGAGGLYLDAGTSVYLRPTNNLYINPGLEAIVDDAKDFVRENSLSGFLGAGWQITSDGHIDARSAYFDELRVTAFIAEIAQAKAGSLWVTPSMAQLSRDFTVPAVDSTATIYVRDLDGFPDTPAFSDGDVVLLRAIEKTTSLAVENIWGIVSSYSDQADGEQSWTFTSKVVPTVGRVVSENLVVLDFGQSGDGFIVSTTLDAAGSPYERIVTWTDNPWTEANRTVHAQWGNLDSIAGIGEEYGFWAGDSPDGSWAKLSDQGVTLQNAALSFLGALNDNGSISIYGMSLVDTGPGGLVSPFADVSSSNMFLGNGATSYHAVLTQNPTGPINEGTQPKIYSQNGESASVTVVVGTYPVVPTSITASFYIALNDFDNDPAQISVQFFKNGGVTELTEDSVVYDAGVDSWTGGEISGTVTVLPGSIQSDWVQPYVTITVNYVLDAVTEQIVLTPLGANGPYMAVGNPAPELLDPGTGGNPGFWVGRDSNAAWSLRVGSTAGLAGPRLVWDGNTNQLEFRTGSGHSNRPIYFDSLGNAYFDGIITIGSSGRLVAGDTTLRAGGLIIKSADFPDTPFPDNMITFYSDLKGGNVGTITSTYSATTFGGIETRVGSSFIYVKDEDIIIDADTQPIRLRSNVATNIEKLRALNDAEMQSTLSVTGAITAQSTLLVSGAITAQSTLSVAGNITATSQLSVGGNIYLQNGADLIIDSSSTGYIAAANAGSNIYMGGSGRFEGGVSIGRGNSAPSYPLDIDSGYTGVMIRTDGTFTQASGLSGTETDQVWGVGVNNSTDGGARIDSFSDNAWATYYRGIHAVADTGEASNSVGSYIFSGWKDTGSGTTAWGDDTNIFVIRNWTAAKVIVKGNGQIYTDTTPVVAFDDYNDAELIMGYSALVDKGAAVQNGYAQWATEHRDLLEELRVVTVNDDEGTIFTNQTLLTQLLVGYAVQSAQRLERIEEENRLLRNRIQQLLEA